MKNESFSLVRTEKLPSVRNLLCELVGNIGATILDLSEEEAEVDSDREWPQLIPKILELNEEGANNEELKESALKIATSLFDLTADDFTDDHRKLYIMLKTGLENDSLKIKFAGMQAIESLFSSHELENIKTFEDLFPLMINTASLIVEKDEDLVKYHNINSIKFLIG